MLSKYLTGMFEKEGGQWVGGKGEGRMGKSHRRPEHDWQVKGET